MSVDANLSSDDMRVECSLDRFERERVTSKSSDPLLSRIAGWVLDEQFLEVAGLDGFARCRVAHALLKLFDMSRSCWHLDVQANAERLCDDLRTERPVLLLGSPKCKAFTDLRSMDR